SQLQTSPHAVVSVEDVSLFVILHRNLYTTLGDVSLERLVLLVCERRHDLVLFCKCNHSTHSLVRCPPLSAKEKGDSPREKAVALIPRRRSGETHAVVRTRKSPSRRRGPFSFCCMCAGVGDDERTRHNF